MGASVLPGPHAESEFPDGKAIIELPKYHAMQALVWAVRSEHPLLIQLALEHLDKMPAGPMIFTSPQTGQHGEPI